MPGLGFFVLMTFTWPLLGGHLVQVLSGAAKAAGFARRIYSAFLLSGGVGVAFIAQDAEEALGHGARQLIIRIRSRMHAWLVCLQSCEELS